MPLDHDTRAAEYMGRCDPAEPLGHDDDRYVELDAGEPVRGTGQLASVNVMKRRIDMAGSAGRTHQFFSGFPGCGKTTELKRLKYELEQSDTLTKVIYVDAEELLDRYTPITTGDVLRVLAWSMEREALISEGKDPDEANGFLERLWGFLQSDVELKELRFEAYGAKLMFEIRSNPSFREKVEKALSLQFQRFAAEAKEAMQQALERMRQARRYRRFVVIVDGLEKLRPLHPGDQANVEAAVESVFLRHAEYLRIPCHAIYTFPLWLQYLYPVGHAFGGAPVVLPMVKLRDRDEGVHEPGYEKLREIARLRVPLDVVFGEGPEPSAVLGKLIEASGGYPKDYLRLIRETIFASTSFPVSEADAKEAISSLSEEYLLAIREEYVDLLAEISVSKGARTLSEEEQRLLVRLVERFLVLAYRNGEPWYDLHPLVSEVPAVAEKIRAHRAGPASTTTRG